MSVLIKGGRVVTAEEEKVADVFVEDETVSQIGESLDPFRKEFRVIESFRNLKNLSG